MKTRDVVHIAMYVGLFAVLEWLSNVVPLLQMPQGGSISLSAIALLMASYHLGFRKGLITALVSFVVMFILKPPYILNVVQFACDYIFAYAAYALACKIPDISYLPLGVIVTNFIRFMFHNIAGWAFFSEYYPGKVLWGVAGYNATYMMPTAIISFIVVSVVKIRLKTIYKKA